jgi:hypothetical protein
MERAVTDLSCSRQFPLAQKLLRSFAQQLQSTCLPLTTPANKVVMRCLAGAWISNPTRKPISFTHRVTNTAQRRAGFGRWKLQSSVHKQTSPSSHPAPRSARLRGPLCLTCQLWLGELNVSFVCIRRHNRWPMLSLCLFGV